MNRLSRTATFACCLLALAGCSRSFGDVRPFAPMQPVQVGFGAGGPHFCLGANLARREITVAFDEIRRRLPDL